MTEFLFFVLGYLVSSVFLSANWILLLQLLLLLLLLVLLLFVVYITWYVSVKGRWWHVISPSGFRLSGARIEVIGNGRC